MQSETQSAIVERLRDLRASFADAHRDGMTSLDQGDLVAFGEAIQREHDIVIEQKALLDAYNVRRA